MKILRCYLYGFMAGVSIEYLYRVKFSPYPLVIVVLIAFMALVDLLSELNKRR